MRSTMLRTLMLAVTAGLMLWAAPLVAQEPQQTEHAAAEPSALQNTQLQLDPPVTDEPKQEPGRSFTLSLDEVLLSEESHSETLKLAIWDSPLGRAEYDVWQLQRTLGTGGLPGAGPSFPFAARYAMPSRPDSRSLFGSQAVRPWHDLTPREKVAKVTTGIVITGALYSLLEALD